MPYPLTHIGIPVPLGNGEKAVVMVVDAHSSHDSTDMVVFAEPFKLHPYMDKINEKSDAAYLRGKHIHAKKGLLEAQKDSSELVGRVFPSELDNPLPMARVYCFSLGGEPPRIEFSDGITRTTELIFQQAQFVPLQATDREASLLHSLVGGERMPQAVSSFIRPWEETMELMREAYDHRVTRHQAHDPKPLP
jgi:hypothetical protein